MKYIGPFLRVNLLNIDNIQSQLFHLSKEALRHITFHSSCGIVSKNLELKNRILPNDDTINSSISPLLCVYRKADGKLIKDGDKFIWNHRKFKREINICANGYMNLCLLYLSDYYSKFLDIDDAKYSLKRTYVDLTKEQLEFFALYCRSQQGVFVDKYDSSDPLQKEYVLTDKDLDFKFSTQALLMACYYKYSTLANNESEHFKNFALEILNMFKQYKHEIYNTSHDELVKICFAFNILYDCSKSEEVSEEVMDLLLDFSELMIENIKHMPASIIRDNISISCLCYLNNIILYKHTNLTKFKDASIDIFNLLENLYDDTLGVFIKYSSDKEHKFSSDEIVLYLSMFLIHNTILDDEEKQLHSVKVQNLYKNQVVNSGLILRWPEPPDIDDAERYRNFSCKSDDFLNDDYFNISSSTSSNSYEFAPILVKNITLNRKKESYKHYKHSFDSYKNMLSFFILIYINTLL